MGVKTAYPTRRNWSGQVLSSLSLAEGWRARVQRLGPRVTVARSCRARRGPLQGIADPWVPAAAQSDLGGSKPQPGLDFLHPCFSSMFLHPTGPLARAAVVCAPGMCSGPSVWPSTRKLSKGRGLRI